MTEMTLISALQNQAKTQSQRGIMYIEGAQDETSISYPELYQRAQGILGWLQQQGVKPGDELIIFLNQNQVFIDIFWACLLGGIIPVPLGVGSSDDHRIKLLKVASVLKTPWVYTSQRDFERLGLVANEAALSASLERIQPHSLFIENIEDIEQPGKIHNVQPDDIAFIQFSSGSTGDPKGVTLTHRNLMTNIHGIISAAEFHSDHSVFLSWMPLTHDMGIIGFHLTPLVLGVQQYLLPTSLFVRRPLIWLQKAAEKRASVLSSPNFGYKHCLKFFSPEKLAGIDLSAVRQIFNGAEPISASLCAEFMHTFAPYGLPANAMFPVYGLAEASLAVSFPPLQRPVQSINLAREQLEIGKALPLAKDGEPGMPVVAVGQVIPGCQLKIADETGAAYPDGHIGHVLIGGDNVTVGYYQNPQANEKALRPGGWVDTGDLGCMHEGDLYITGRAKDLLIINGQNYYPHDLENLAEQLAEVDTGKVAVCGVREADGDTDHVIVFLMYKDSLEAFLPLAQTLKQHLATHTGLEILHVLPIRALPKTTSGKLQRYALADRYMTGEFAQEIEQLAALSHSSAGQSADSSAIEQQLRQICASVISDKSVQVEDNLFELGTTSLKLAQIHEQIEEYYPGVLDMTDFFDYPTIKDLAAHLQSKLEAGA